MPLYAIMPYLREERWVSRMFRNSELACNLQAKYLAQQRSLFGFVWMIRVAQTLE